VYIIDRNDQQDHEENTGNKFYGDQFSHEWFRNDGEVLPNCQESLLSSSCWPLPKITL
jgi:hypothetical protein